MKKMMVFFVAMTVAAFVYMGAGVFAAEMKEPAETKEPIAQMKEPMGKTHEESSLRIGKAVKNMEGENLGTVRDFVRDSEGRISFAIVSHGGFMGFGGKEIAVPYSALNYDTERQYFTCNVSKDQLASALELENEEQLKDRSFAEDVYRHFGQRPYWTDEPKGTDRPEGTKERKGTEKSY